MTYSELNQEQKQELYSFWLMDLVNDNKITWETMCSRLYDDFSEHEKALSFYHSGIDFVNDDFFCSAEL